MKYYFSKYYYKKAWTAYSYELIYLITLSMLLFVSAFNCFEVIIESYLNDIFLFIIAYVTFLALSLLFIRTIKRGIVSYRTCKYYKKIVCGLFPHHHKK